MTFYFLSLEWINQLECLHFTQNTKIRDLDLSPFLYIGNRYLHVSAIEKEFVQQKFSEAIDQPPMECPFVYTMSCILTAEKYKMGRKKIPVRMQHFLEFLFYCFIFLVSSIVC